MEEQKLMDIMLGSPIRCQFPIFQNNEVKVNNIIKPLVYLDSAVSAQKPACVINAMTQHLTCDYGSVHRGAYSLSIRSSQMFEDARAKTAQFISPSLKPEQIVFTKSSTESLNILARGVAHEYLNEGSRIVVAAAEHHSNLIPWQQAALYKNCEIAYIPLSGKQGSSLQLNLTEAKKLITKNTKVVSLAFMGNVLGQINPIREIAELAKNAGALLFIDCAQSVSCLNEDLFLLGADAIVFSAHKMYGPSGIGVLAMKEELINHLPPLLYGGGMVSDVSLEGATWATKNTKFEAGTPPITQAIGLGASIDWLQKVGRERLHKHSSSLASLFIEEIRKLPFIEVYSPETGQETLVSFRHKKVHAHDLATILDADNIAMRAGHHCAWPLIKFLEVDALLRCSFAAYNDKDDIYIALEAIKNSSKMM